MKDPFEVAMIELRKRGETLERTLAEQREFARQYAKDACEEGLADQDEPLVDEG